MKTSINNCLRVYQVVTSTRKQAFCNITELNEVIEHLDCKPGYFKIYHFWDNKPKRLSKKELNLMFEGSNIEQKFTY